MFSSRCGDQKPCGKNGTLHEGRYIQNFLSLGLIYINMPVSAIFVHYGKCGVFVQWFDAFIHVRDEIRVPPRNRIQFTVTHTETKSYFISRRKDRKSGSVSFGRFSNFPYQHVVNLNYFELPSFQMCSIPCRVDRTNIVIY